MFSLILPENVQNAVKYNLYWKKIFAKVHKLQGQKGEKMSS